MEPVDTVLAALKAHDCKLRKSGVGWEAQCPAHDDKRASLSINEARDGKALLRCHAGCELDAILSHLELKTRHLFPARERSSRAKIASVYQYTDETGTLLYEVV